MEVADPEDLVVPEPGVPDELVQPVEPLVVPEHEAGAGEATHEGQEIVEEGRS